MLSRPNAPDNTCYITIKQFVRHYFCELTATRSMSVVKPVEDIPKSPPYNIFNDFTVLTGQYVVVAQSLVYNTRCKPSSYLRKIKIPRIESHCLENQ